MVEETNNLEKWRNMLPPYMWLRFKPTGVQVIDDILAMVSHCAKIQRNTEYWDEDGLGPEGMSVIQAIQNVADESASRILARQTSSTDLRRKTEMHIQEKWICDECGSEFNSAQKMFRVTSFVTECEYGTYVSSMGKLQKQVCLPCANAMMRCIMTHDEKLAKARSLAKSSNLTMICLDTPDSLIEISRGSELIHRIPQFALDDLLMWLEGYKNCHDYMK